MQTDIPVAVSEGVINRACDSAVSETFEECGSVASPEATLLSQWRKPTVVTGVTRGGSSGEKAGFIPFIFSSLERVERGAT